MEKKKSKLYSKQRRQSHLYHIIDKRSEKVVFVRNEAQDKLKEYMDEIKERKGRVRLMILKGRQLGITTDACIRLLDEVVVRKNRNVVITAHEQESQKQIFEKVKFAYENIPSVKMIDGKVWTPPKQKYYTKSLLHLDHGNNDSSKIQVMLNTRSGTVSTRHITELAFRDDAQDMITGSLPSVPQDSDIVIETTANGTGNYFHKLWTDNYNNPKGVRDCLFLGWYWDSQYTLPIPSGDTFLLPSELAHLNTIKDHRGEPLSEEQKHWYYVQRLSLGREVFQEYPSTPEEAFLSTGDTVIDKIKLQELIIPKVIHEPLRGLKIYRKHENDDILYFRGVDTATGTANGDYSSIEIRDKEYNLYATYYNKVGSDELVKVMDYLRKQGYIGINLGVERNGVGMATITEASHYPRYEYIYNEVKTDEISQRPSKQYGIHTGSAGNKRKSMIEHWVGLIRKGLLTEFSQETINEMYTFIYATGDRPEAAQGSHDDAIMTSVICCWTIETRQFI